MQTLVNLTTIISFWASISGAWFLISYENNLNNAPVWWRAARERWYGGVLFIICAGGIVLPMILLFSLPT